MITTDITLFIQIVNMVVLMFLLNGVLYKPIKNILRERSEKLRGMEDSISKFEKNAKLRQEEVDAKMAKASGRAKAALDGARAEAQAAGDEKLSAIRADADATKEAKLAELRADIERARTSLKSNLDGFATDMASKILGRSL
ncbi:MAG: ATP synthase subunit B' [Desulfobulbaceae bacterium BRH_c16a]|nr:MAG: ATP synthase subunit B' [Desulfobulbaceae bacterium BRH_c16a]